MIVVESIGKQYDKPNFLVCFFELICYYEKNLINKKIKSLCPKSNQK